MAEQALKTTNQAPTDNGQGEGVGVASAPIMGEGKELVVKNDDSKAVIVAKSSKSITDSVTYQNNRKYILATLQLLQSNFQPLGVPNILRERFEINVAQELPQFSRTHAKAYVAVDLKQPDKLCIALVVEPYFPHRHELIDKIKANISVGQNIANYAILLDAGVVHVEAWKENRMVLFYEQPKGVKLADLMEQETFSKQSDVVKNIIEPILCAITSLNNLGIVHGGINPHNIYVNKRDVVLWDCVAQPCGYGHPDIYEPIERLSAQENMRGEPTLESDIYALAILAIDSCGLLDGKKQFTVKQLYPAYLQKGVYNVLVDEAKITSAHLLDLTRGVLCENPTERWGLEQLKSFVGGKRYNLVSVGTIKEVSRSFAFVGNEYVTLRSLAFAYLNNWDLAIESIRDAKLVKWLDTLLQKSDIRETVERMQMRAVRSPSKGKSADEVISKTISSLDPLGAVRTRQFAMNPTAVGQTLSVAFKMGDLTQQINIREMIESEFVGFWRDLSKYNAGQLTWSPEQIRLLLKSQSAGFGIERVLYEINPTLPCMSRNYARFHSLSAKHMMLVLESLAKDHADDKLYDKHMLAFLAARAGIKKEVHIKDFRGYELQNSTELQAIMLLALVQEKTKIDSLPALSCWAALRIAEMIEQFHSMEVRQSISRDMQAVLPRGKLSYLLRVLHNKEHIKHDTQGHSKAVHLFMRGNTKIKYYRDKEMIAKKAELGGNRFAFSISLIIFLMVVSAVSTKYIF